MSIKSVRPPNHLILCHPLPLPLIFPSIMVFSKSWLCSSGGQSIEVSALVLQMNIQGWFLLGLTGLISLLYRDSQEVSPTPQFESINSLVLSLYYGPVLTSVCDYWKNVALTICTFVGKVMSLLFKTLSTFVIAFLPGSKRLLFLWLQLPSAVILEPKKIKSVTVSTFSPLPWSDGTGCHDLSF